MCYRLDNHVIKFWKDLMCHKLLSFEAIFLICHIQLVEPLIQRVVETKMQWPGEENTNLLQDRRCRQHRCMCLQMQTHCWCPALLNSAWMNAKCTPSFLHFYPLYSISRSKELSCPTCCVQLLPVLPLNLCADQYWLNSNSRRKVIPS